MVMNSSMSLRADDTMPAPPLVWCVWPISFLPTQSYRLLFCVVMLPVITQVGGLNARSIATGAGMTYMIVITVIAAVFVYATTPSHDGDVFALSLALQHAQYAVMLCLLSASILPQPKYIDLRTFYSIWAHCVFGVYMVMLCTSLAGSASNIRSSSVFSTSCDVSTGVCTNPCEDMVVRSYRDAEEKLLPIIWSMGNAGPADASRWSATNQWIVDAAKVNDSTYSEFIRLLWSAYFLVGPLYECLRAISKGPPKDIRNRIFRRLQQDYRPKLQSASPKRRFFLRVMVWARYAWIFLSMISMDIRIFQKLIRFALWAGNRIYVLYTDEEPVSFGRLVVLEHNWSPQRRKLAKYLAASWYLWSLAFIVLFPSFCVFIIVRSELYIRGWVPQRFSFIDQGQWMAWAMFGAAVIIYTIWYLLFEVAAKWGLEERRTGDDRTKIYIADPTVDEHGPEMVALLERNIEDNDWSWTKRLAARVTLEWYEFTYWWRHPSTDTKPKKPVDPWNWDDTWRRGGGRGEIPNWAAFPNELASYPSSSRHIPLVPEPKATVKYSYDDEEETQRLLYEREGRRRRRG